MTVTGMWRKWMWIFCDKPHTCKVLDILSPTNGIEPNWFGLHSADFGLTRCVQANSVQFFTWLLNDQRYSQSLAGLNQSVDSNTTTWMHLLFGSLANLTSFLIHWPSGEQARFDWLAKSVSAFWIAQGSLCIRTSPIWRACVFVLHRAKPEQRPWKWAKNGRRVFFIWDAVDLLHYLLQLPSFSLWCRADMFASFLASSFVSCYAAIILHFKCCVAPSSRRAGGNVRAPWRTILQHTVS